MSVLARSADDVRKSDLQQQVVGVRLDSRLAKASEPQLKLLTATDVPVYLVGRRASGYVRVSRGSPLTRPRALSAA